MNNKKIISLLPLAIAMGILTSQLMVSCKDSAKENDSAVSQSDITQPEVDLHTAVLTENLEAVKQHIAAGSNLNEKDPFGGSSPLITAALFGKTEMARVLIDAGADINFQNKDGSTALHTAAFFCRPEIVKILLEKGADKTIKNNFGATAFESMTPPFNDVKNIYDMMGKVLGPMGLKMDYVYIEKTRPEIAAMLN
jgi:hypothetical protein